MIEVTLRQIVDSAETMRELSNKPLKGRVAYRIARLLRELDKEFSLFNEKRTDLVKEYVIKDENGELKTDENGDLVLDKERIQEFYTAINDLLNTQVSINAEKVDLVDLESIEFTPAQIMLLEPFINE